MAMLLSSFREAILIDADVVFLADPTILLSDPDFMRLGALFFRDRLLSPTSRASFIAKSLPSPLSPNILRSNRWWLGKSGHMQESGVVVVDKWRHFVALLLTTRLNGPDRDGNDAIQKKGVYQMMYGDKETYWLSWEMAGDSDYAFYNGRAGQIGVLTPSNTKDGLEGEEMCGKQLLHISREGRPLWFNGWLSTDKHREDHLTNFQDFKGFIPEPQETLRQDLQYWNGWIVRQGNIMCLTNDGYIPLSAKENETVGRILRTAEEVVASGSW
jgi:alpha 1,3-mannosyltransferase